MSGGGDGGGDKGEGGTSASDIAGMGLSIGGKAVKALDKNPDYNNADVLSSTLEYGAMGAAGGAPGIALASAVGFGVGMLKKKQFETEQDIKEDKEEVREGTEGAMKSRAEVLEGYAKGGVINKYATGGDTEPVKKTDHTKNEELIALKDSLKDKPGRNAEIKDAVEAGYSNLYTEQEIADATDPLTAYMTKYRENMSDEELAKIYPQSFITENKGLWDEDKGMIWNARNLLDKAVHKVQHASLRPGGSGGRKNIVTTGLSELFALPSINRLIKPDGDIEHIMHDPGDGKAWLHAGLNVIGAAPGASLVSSTVRSKAGQLIPQLKGSATQTIDKVSDFVSSLIGEKGVTTLGVAAPWLRRTEKVLHQSHRVDEISDAVAPTPKDYAIGGMTQGAYNHTTNPLTVVDKNGNHTGMELTGGEGVFDKPAMDKIKKLLKGGKFDEVGAFVNNEMKTWKHT